MVGFHYLVYVLNDLIMCMKNNNTQIFSAKELIANSFMQLLYIIIKSHIPSYLKMHYIHFNFVDSTNYITFAYNDLLTSARLILLENSKEP